VPRASTDQLAAVPLFSGLTDPELRELVQASDEVEAEAGRELTTEGRVGHEFFLILEGEASVRRQGKEVTTLEPGDYFGELSILDRGPRSATVAATTDMKLLVLGQREFGGLLETLPGLAAKLLPSLAHRLREADQTAFRY